MASCPRDEVVGYLERYAAGLGAPVETSAGRLEAQTVVLSTGAYQRPHRPAGAATLPTVLLEDYSYPAELPPGPVLVIGGGQSGCQIAEELHEAGREVFLACGPAAWAPRRLGDHDVYWWLHETGYLDDSLSSLPSPAARLATNLQATGHAGGHDLHYRTLQSMGVTQLGHFLGADGRRARFAADLGESVAWGDQRNARFMDLIRKLVAERGLTRPEIPEPEPSSVEAPERLDLSGFSAVVFAGAFRPDYQSWVHCPGAFDEFGFRSTTKAPARSPAGSTSSVSTSSGRRKSSLLVGVGEDAAIVARQIATGEVAPAA